MSTTRNYHSPAPADTDIERIKVQDFTSEPGVRWAIIHLEPNGGSLWISDAGMARQLLKAAAEALAILEPPVAGHAFIRPGQIAPDRPVPDRCMECGQPENAHSPVARPVEVVHLPEPEECPRHGWKNCLCSGAPDYAVDPVLVADDGEPAPGPEACSKCGATDVPLIDGRCHNTGACGRRQQAARDAEAAKAGAK